MDSNIISGRDVPLRPAASPSAAESGRPQHEHNAKNPPPAQRGGPAPDAVVRQPRSPQLRDVASAAIVKTGDAARTKLVTALLAKVPAADRAAARTAIPAILDAAQNAGTTDPNRIGYLLATAQTESDFGANMTETGHSKEWYNRTYGCDDGNRPGTNDGYAYRGRGYVQITHAGRYAEMSKKLGLPAVPAVEHGAVSMKPALIAHPERLTDPKLAAQALVVGVERNLFTHNRAAALDATIPAGRKPGDVDFYHARGIVNGIVHSQAAAIAKHATAYAEVVDRFHDSVREPK